jgi:peptidoglycan hydrolase-like protein with peptidoglycan-binding domain
VNFLLIPQIKWPNGVFDSDTQNAVKIFQRENHLTPDGIVGKDTWNKIGSVYVGVIKLGELDSEGVRDTIGRTPPNAILSQGSRGKNVLELQFILDALSKFYSAVPSVIQDSVFDTNLEKAVVDFQRAFGLSPDGVVGPDTWSKLYAAYRGILDNANIPPAPPVQVSPAYPGALLRLGSSGASVLLMQRYLNKIHALYPNIPLLDEDGLFGGGTRRAVIAFQNQFMLVPDGIIGPVTWNKIVQEFSAVSDRGAEPAAWRSFTE